MREVLDNLQMTAIWPKTCLWINETSYTGQAYQCNNASVTDSCKPCWLSAEFPCGSEMDYSFLDDGCPLFGYYPWIGSSLGRRRKLVSSRSLKLEGPGVSFANVATRAIEGFAGTFALPNNNVSCA
jgi:hypothetical protein